MSDNNLLKKTMEELDSGTSLESEILEMLTDIFYQPMSDSTYTVIISNIEALISLSSLKYVMYEKLKTAIIEVYKGKKK